MSNNENIITTASNAISAWDNARQSSANLYNYFNQGNSFVISAADVANWANTFESNDTPASAQYIHCYLGLEGEGKNATLQMYAVDSATDEKVVSTNEQAYLDNIKAIPFSVSLGENIEYLSLNNPGSNDSALSAEEALKVYMRWNLSSNDWINNNAGENMLQAFNIPFSDFSEITTVFSQNNKTPDQFVLLLALKYDSKNVLEADAVLWGSATDAETGILTLGAPQNIIRPVPPYKPEKSDYQLLIYSE